MRLELLDIGGDLPGLVAFALRSRECSLERVGRCGAVTALALLVEMHRRAVQAERERCGFRGFGRSPEVLAGEVGKAEFALAAHLPQEIRIEPGGKRPRIREQRRRRRFAETQQDVGGLDLEPLARCRFDLQRRSVVSKDGAGLERAVVLEKHMHELRNL